MKLKLKLLAAALGIALGGGANAAITNSASGNGELFFTIYDVGADLSSNADDRAYVLELGSLLDGGAMNQWVSPTTSAPLPALNATKQGFGTIYSIGADANLASFLGASTDTSRLKWNIAAGDSSGTDRVMTTADSIATAQLPTYTQFRSNFASKIDGYISGYLTTIPDGGSILLAGASAGLAAWSNNFGGGSAFTNAGDLGDSLGFFVLSERVSSGSTTSKADLRQFMADGTTRMEWTLANDGTLTYAAAVPEPGTWAMLAAGLLMVGGIARRRLS